MTARAAADLNLLYQGKAGRVDFVDVPEVAVLAVRGEGDPNGPMFADAIQALFTVSYGAHFLVKKRDGTAPKVMPLEALWWADDADERGRIFAAALGEGEFGGGDRASWRWRAMMVQRPPIDAGVIAAAVAKAEPKHIASLERIEFERWTEGLCAQVLHVGPYADEGPTIVALHEAVAAAGYTPRGRHHEIYLGDPRRSAPQRLRTLLRQPVEPAVRP